MNIRIVFRIALIATQTEWKIFQYICINNEFFWNALTNVLFYMLWLFALLWDIIRCGEQKYNHWSFISIIKHLFSINCVPWIIIYSKHSYFMEFYCGRSSTEAMPYRSQSITAIFCFPAWNSYLRRFIRTWIVYIANAAQSRAF